jgi:hypothetical protein
MAARVAMFLPRFYGTEEWFAPGSQPQARARGEARLLIDCDNALISGNQVSCVSVDATRSRPPKRTFFFSSWPYSPRPGAGLHRPSRRRGEVDHRRHRQPLLPGRLIAPERDWRWLASLKARLAARAKPEDRFDRLVPPCQIHDFGIELMDEAIKLPTGRKQREIQYRDGLQLAILSLWLLRRRSFAALTTSRHLEVNATEVNMVLFPEDTKAKRAVSLFPK